MFRASLGAALLLAVWIGPVRADDATAPAQPAPPTAPSQPTPPTAPTIKQPAAKPAPAPAAAPANTPKIPKNATVLGKNEIQGVVGKKVLSSTGEDMGEITNVIVDRSGQPRAVVIDFGGFLGVGSRKIAVDWNALHFAPQGKTDRVTLDLTRDELKSAPAYVEGKPVVAIGASGHSQTVPPGELP